MKTGEKTGEEGVLKEEINKKVEEALMPSLGSREVTIGNGDKSITFKVSEMPVYYVKKLNRLMEPFYSILRGGEEIDIKTFINADKFDQFEDDILKASALIYTYHTTGDDQDEQVILNMEKLGKICSEKQLFNIILAQMEAQGLVNFLKSILTGVINILPKIGSLNQQQNT